jgi:ribosomal protein L11 methyltransferase
MNNYCIRFPIKDESEGQMLMAQLLDYPFYSFVEKTESLEAYITAEDWTTELKVQLEQTAAPFSMKYQEEFLPYENWNAVWESNFQPIQVGDFCGIRAGFHPPLEQVKHEILIDPEMAFGTGHHATTYMVIELMQAIDFREKVVFDYGCGTGILAILAAKLGASLIDAIDISIQAFENTLKNISVNAVNNIHIVHGEIDKIIREDYDIILANINRNVLLASMATLFTRVKPHGIVLLSGILHQDFSEVKQAAARSGFFYEKHLEKEGWIAMRLRRPG